MPKEKYKVNSKYAIHPGNQALYDKVQIKNEFEAKLDQVLDKNQDAHDDSKSEVTQQEMMGVDLQDSPEQAQIKQEEPVQPPQEQL